MRRIEVLILAVVVMSIGGCKPSETQTLLEPSKALAAVLAEEAIHAAGANKRIAVITHDDSWGAPSTVEKDFDDAVEKAGFSVSTAKAAFLGDPMHRSGLGLQPEDFFEALQNATDAGVIVSFAGAPLLAPEDVTKAPHDHPPIVVVATRMLGGELGVPATADRLNNLLGAKVIQVAIVNGGSDSDPAESGKTDDAHRTFAQNFTILRQPQ
jgi:hypothetical protein